jgi:hypothetical protein
MAVAVDKSDRGKNRKKCVMRPETERSWLQPMWQEGTGVGESGLWTKHDQVLIDQLGEDVFPRLILDAPIGEQARVRLRCFAFPLCIFEKSLCMCEGTRKAMFSHLLCYKPYCCPLSRPAAAAAVIYKV